MVNIEAAFSIIAIIISVGALIISFWQGYLTRKHNKLSVKPHLVFWANYFADSGETGVFIKNYGIGPAVIKKISIFIDGEIFIENDQNDFHKQAISQVEFQSGNLRFYEIPKDIIFPVGKIERFLWETQNYYSNPDIKTGFDRLNYKIEYESIYGEKFIAKWK
jgi:hypothetical protein